MVTPGTSLWTTNDTALALALQRIEATRCPGCGQDRRESMAAENEFAYTAHAIRCHACAARDRTSASQMKQDLPTPGLAWVVTKQDRSADV